MKYKHFKQALLFKVDSYLKPRKIRKVETQNFPLRKNKNILKEKYIFL